MTSEHRGLRAFGSLAQLAAKDLPAQLPAIVVDASGIGEAYFEAVERRVAAQPFFLMPLIDDPRVAHGRMMAASIVAQIQDHDSRRTALAQLASGDLGVNGKPFREVAILNAGVAHVTRELLRLSDGLLVRSTLEAEMLSRLLGMRVRTHARIVPLREFPRASERGTSGVVVFAPQLQQSDLALYEFALSSLHLPVTFMTGSGPYRDQEIANAACVIDASASDPSWAVSLAQRGYRLAIAATSGAREYLSNVAVYDPIDERSILRAALAALGAEPAFAFGIPTPRDVLAALEASAPPEIDAAPLVSVIIPTYNRHADLREAVRSLLGQEYPNIEVIVVNDGGEAVGNMFASEARVRVFDREVNVGAFRAENFGIEHARGKYVQLLADDDVLYADHVARLVAALEHSGAAVAHGNVLIRYERVESDGTRRLDGFNASVFVNPLDPFDALISTPIAGQALMLRRDVYERFGTFDADCALADQEHQMRIARELDFVHVDRITGEWRIRDAGDAFSSNKNEQFATALEQIYARLPSDRPAIEASRRATIQKVRNRPPGYVFAPTIRLSR